MKLVLVLLLFPLFAISQTVHINEGKIEYNEKVKVNGVPQATLSERAKEALLIHAQGDSDSSNIDNNEAGEAKSKGKIKLNAPYSIIKTVHYTITLKTSDGEYKYKIHKVYVKEKARGYKTKEIPSEDLVKDMEGSGIPAIEAEKLLNEIDMKFQKLIVLINNTMKSNKNLKADNL